MLESIVFGGGCFWCTEAVFKMVPGVLEVIPGYAGGEDENPDYDSVCSGKTGHAEVVKVDYDTEIVDFDRLLEIFFGSHDPTTLNQQGNDRGTQYRSVILYTNESQKTVCENYIKSIAGDYNDSIVTELKLLGKFYPAEDYHKDYFAKNPEQPYCSLVVAPKIAKVRKKFGL